MSAFKSILFFILLSTIFIVCRQKKDTETLYDSLAIEYTVLNVLPHDPLAFTQGLVINDSKILESTGQNASWIAEVNPGTGQQDKKKILGDEYFGEGITVLNKKLYQLTWKNKVGFIYDLKTYKQLGEFTYAMEGWGITHDNKNLIMSDGSEKLYFLDTVSLKIVKTIIVKDGNTPVKKLNELEYVNGSIFANVWETSLIVKIDPANGNVIGKLDLSRITNEINQMYPQADVLNGIAYDVKSKAFLITGKLWPQTYLIRLGKGGKPLS